jgi:hypothetical protein
MLTDGPHLLAESHHQPISLVGRFTKRLGTMRFDRTIRCPFCKSRASCVWSRVRISPERYGFTRQANGEAFAVFDLGLAALGQCAEAQGSGEADCARLLSGIAAGSGVVVVPGSWLG